MTLHSTQRATRIHHTPFALRSRIPASGKPFLALVVFLFVSLLVACGETDGADSTDATEPAASTEGKAVPEILQDEDAGDVWADQIGAQLIEVQETYRELEQAMDEAARDSEILVDETAKEAAAQYHEALLATEDKVDQAVNASEELSAEAKSELEDELRQLEEDISALRDDIGSEDDAPAEGDTSDA